MIGVTGKTKAVLVGAILVLASASLATALTESLRPKPRHTAPASGAFDASKEAVLLAAMSPFAVQESTRPAIRNASKAKKAMSRQQKATRQAQRRGLCGLAGVQGETVGYVPGRLSACGIKDAVRVTSVSGVALSTSAVMDCTTAKALKTWVDSGAVPAFRRQGGGLVKLRVAAGYACRTRNNQPGAKISEHGKGKAIDISGFTLADGSEVSVLKGWDSRQFRKPMRQLQSAACGPFGTVLGPNSNRFHRDHFHFDTASYRSGPYCR